MINKKPLSQKMFNIISYEMDLKHINYEFYKTNKGYFIYTIKEHKEIWLICQLEY